MLEIDSLNKPKTSSLEKVAVPKVTLTRANVYNCYSEKVIFLMNNLNCEGV